MHRSIRAAAVLGFLLITAVSAEAQVDARLLRQPDVSATQIAFVYGGDIWVAPKEGGVAQRLSTPKGEESFPRFSPDGASIAFTGNYDGNSDIYVMPVGGGLPTRLTHHPDPDRMLDWYPDGKDILFATPMTSEKQRFRKLYRVPATGGPAGALRRVRCDLSGRRHSGLHAVDSGFPDLEEVSGRHGARDLALRVGGFSGKEHHRTRGQ